MATINNSDLTKELIEGAEIQISYETVPHQLADKVVPVMEVNPKLLRRCNVAKFANVTNATSGTIYTTPSDRDFYLVGCTLATIADVTATSTYSALKVVIEGVSINILQIPRITLTVSSGTLSLTLPFPLKIDRASSIQVLHTTNVANVVTSGSIAGYLD